MTNKSLSFLLPCRATARIITLCIISFVCFTQIQAKNILAQDLNARISLNVVNKPVKDVLRQINKETKLSFVFSNAIVTDQAVSLTVKNEQLSVVLKKLLYPLGMDYSLSGSVILIDKRAIVTETGSSAIKAPVTVTGKVIDNTGAELPGVSIRVKDSNAGTVTGVDGRYKITVPDENSVLVFTYMGFAKQEIPVGGRTTIDVKLLMEEKNSLNEVVVTALGISRQKKALAYSVTEVKGDEFTQARENNVANALTGKVAGVNATGLSTGPGGSSRILIRGNGSLGGGNQPLYVVNGMPIDNSVPGGSATANGGGGNTDRGDGIGGINPDDIESISVLKGGTAAALYGARAANGVILITTKKGKAQAGIGVELNSTYTAETPAVFPDFQYEYGQGDKGVKPMTQSDAITTGRRSFGAKIDGSTFIAADGKEHPYVAQRDNIKNFYRTGSTLTNTLAFTGGNEAVNFRFSMADLNSKSVLPNSNFDRKTFNLNVSGKVSKKLSFEALAQYNIENAKNRASAGDALGNPNWTPYMSANTTDIRWLAPGYDANNNEIAWNDAPIASNSYFVVNKYQQKDTKNRFIGQAGITYEFVKNLSLKGVVSRDFYAYNYSYILPTGTLYIPNGQYNEIKADASETNGLLTLNYNGKIKDFGISAFVGANQQRSVYNQLNTIGSNFIIPYFYSSTNLSTISTTPTNNKTAINSLMGSADFSYKNFAYLTVTGRQDWFSTLSPQNNNIFYPSVGGSFVLSEAFKLPQSITYAKVRASWAQVGGGAPDPYQINQAFIMQPSSGQPLQSVASTTITNRTLRPYTSTTTEAGIEARFLNNRLGFDVTLYDRKTTDDIVQTAITGTSGYNNVLLNVGELSNRGIEVLLNGTPVKTGNFSWSTSYNFAYNQNKVLKLAAGLNQIQLASSVNGWGYINNIIGQPFGSIVGTRMQKDASGNVVFNATTGLPVATGLQTLGNGVAPLTMGFSNDFKYKRFSLNILVDGKFGNKVLSLMEIYGTRLGLMKTTLPGRDGGLAVSGVDQTGKPYSRTVPVSDLRTYYDNYKSYSDLFLHDASFVKLRQVILSYSLPVEWLRSLSVKSASLSLVGRNLAILYKKTDNFDPESSITNSSAQGIESFGLPRTRSFGLNLMAKF